VSALYNEIDGFAAAWLRNLVAAGHIADGTVDQRSIKELAPDDCTATQCHFFAGIAGWSRALRLAGWPDDVPVWTGSCPCQPFSCAGTQRGFADERHLWPDWFRLIRECRPPVIFGEQVASKVAASWLDAVFDDLEGVGYACWAAVLPACSVGAFHRRYRIYFVAHSERGRSGTRGTGGEVREAEVESHRLGAVGELADAGRTPGRAEQLDEPRQGLRWKPTQDNGAGSGECGESDRLAHTAPGGLGIDGGAPGNAGHASHCEPARGMEHPNHGLHNQPEGEDRETNERAESGRAVPWLGGAGSACGMGNPSGTRSGRDAGTVPGPQGEGAGERGGARGITDEPVVAGATGWVGDSDESGLEWARENQPGRDDGDPSCGAIVGGPGAGFWDDVAWLQCSDGKARPVESCSVEVADGLSDELGLVRFAGYPPHQDKEALIFSPLVAKGRNRVGRLRGYGNAIVPPLAATFIRIFMESMHATDT
jgi:DNA (cytosine-5)-methyltransferase 1